MIAQSVRLMAQSAAKAGLQVVALDCYGDRDTLQCVSRHALLREGDDGLVDVDVVSEAEKLTQDSVQAKGFIYGSGIEHRPHLIAKLAKGLFLCGNAPDTLRQANEPGEFFDSLRALDIPFPETRLQPPWPDGSDWLIKCGCSEGGKRVRSSAKIAELGHDDYMQRRIHGHGLSVLFLADGERGRIVGFNTLWTVEDDMERPFLFGGAVNRTDLNDEQRVTMIGYVNKLTRKLRLIGLNSLDFIREGRVLRVLELNPRPSATMALYDDDYPHGLIAEHIAACCGILTDYQPRPGPVRAFRIVYANEMTCIRDDIDWPMGSADLPMPGSIIRAGEPICSLLSEAEDVDSAANLLEWRQSELLVQLSPL